MYTHLLHIYKHNIPYHFSNNLSSNWKWMRKHEIIQRNKDLTQNVKSCVIKYLSHHVVHPRVLRYSKQQTVLSVTRGLYLYHGLCCWYWLEALSCEAQSSFTVYILCSLKFDRKQNKTWNGLSCFVDQVCRQSTKTYNTYQLSHIYIVTSWWWATSKPETCRGIVTE
jgi:hypothetical protein